jgi:hypothetical protein
MNPKDQKAAERKLELCIQLLQRAAIIKQQCDMDMEGYQRTNMASLKLYSGVCYDIGYLEGTIKTLRQLTRIRKVF